MHDSRLEWDYALDVARRVPTDFPYDFGAKSFEDAMTQVAIVHMGMTEVRFLTLDTTSLFSVARFKHQFPKASVLVCEMDMEAYKKIKCAATSAIETYFGDVFECLAYRIKSDACPNVWNLDFTCTFRTVESPLNNLIVKYFESAHSKLVLRITLCARDNMAEDWDGQHFRLETMMAMLVWQGISVVPMEWSEVSAKWRDEKMQIVRKPKGWGKELFRYEHRNMYTYVFLLKKHDL